MYALELYTGFPILVCDVKGATRALLKLLCKHRLQACSTEQVAILLNCIMMRSCHAQRTASVGHGGCTGIIGAENPVCVSEKGERPPGWHWARNCNGCELVNAFARRLTLAARLLACRTVGCLMLMPTITIGGKLDRWLRVLQNTGRTRAHRRIAICAHSPTPL